MIAKNKISIMMIKRVLGLSLLSVMILFRMTSFAQEELNKEVRVVKAYNPTISDAFKARFRPVLADTIKFETNFNYLI